jgi:hypothetical protein
MAYATPADVEARLGRSLDTSETLVVQTRLNDAELLLKSRIPDLDQKILDGTISQDAVVMIESEMVLRLVRNPEGYTSETDGSYSYQISAEVASGKLSVLPYEWALLGIRGGLYTIAPYMQMPTATWPPEIWKDVV